MLLIKLLLLPFSILFWLVTQIRNRMFSSGLLKSTSYAINLISVGNLTTGGTGKTPHIEYLVNLLGDKSSIATLSRGYKRKTKGFVLANEKSDANTLGDEPMQFYNKFHNVKVAVDEDRRNGISKLLKTYPEINTILLDDAYQHRWVLPSLNILLIDYSNIGKSDFLIPAGRLRESKKNSNRADAIIISKCPNILSPIEKRRVLEDLSYNDNQKVFFSYIDFKPLLPVTSVSNELIKSGFKLSDHKVIGLSGIANASNFSDHLSRYSKEVHFITFQDHHDYSLADIIRLEKELSSYTGQGKIIVTTEKDAVKLLTDKLYPVIKNLPVFVLPIEVKFHEETDILSFNEYILSNVKSN